MPQATILVLANTCLINHTLAIAKMSKMLRGDVAFLKIVPDAWRIPESVIANKLLLGGRCNIFIDITITKGDLKKIFEEQGCINDKGKLLTVHPLKPSTKDMHTMF